MKEKYTLCSRMVMITDIMVTNKFVITMKTIKKPLNILFDEKEVTI